MTQIASLLAVAAVFVDLWTPFYRQSGRGGLYARQKYLCRNLSYKFRGILCARGGRNRGILWYRIAGNFRMVLIFVYFVCSIPYTKIKTAKI